MRQEITERNSVDKEGLPAGGCVLGKGIDIVWQNGPLGRGDDRREPNGAFVEGVIQAAIGRLRWYQDVSDGHFHCEQNARAITHLEAALIDLDERTANRERRGVEGTHEK